MGGPPPSLAELALNDAGASKKVTVEQVLNNRLLVDVVTADVTNSTTTAAKITDLDMAVPVGKFRFTYYIRYQAAALTTGVKFSVNYTGTVSFMVYNLRWQESTQAASSGAASQAAAGGTLQAGASARAKSTAAGTGPSASVDAINSDMLAIIEGIAEATVAGNLELYHASEVAAATTVKAGSQLEVSRNGA